LIFSKTGPRPLIWKKKWSTSHNNNLNQFWLKFACWFWGGFFFFLLFRYISPCRRVFLFIWINLEFPFPKEDFCRVWLKLDQVFRRKSRICKAFTDERTDDRQEAIRKLNWAFRSSEPKNLTSKIQKCTIRTAGKKL
jgi:hypothetical protein